MSKPVVAIVDPYTSSAMLAPALREAGLSPVAVMDYTGPELAPLHGSHVAQNYDALINHHGDFDDITVALLADAQTSGGLLLCWPDKAGEAPGAVIGTVTEGPAGRISLV